MIRTKSYIEKLPPEQKPNIELMLMGIATAEITQGLAVGGGNYYLLISTFICSE
jgi:hypothetical protein